MSDKNEVRKLSNLGSALPDIYIGDLNTERIKQYRELTELFRLSESGIAHIFNKGADWYKSLLQVDKEELGKLLKIISRFSDFLDEDDKIFLIGLVEKTGYSNAGEAIRLLKRLCDLKAYKEGIGKDDYYKELQPLAWKEANEFLAKL